MKLHKRQDQIVFINGLWEWLSATISRVIAAKNRSHDLKTMQYEMTAFHFLSGSTLAVSGAAH
jgi:hypothetical protein